MNIELNNDDNGQKRRPDYFTNFLNYWRKNSDKDGKVSK